MDTGVEQAVVGVREGELTLIPGLPEDAAMECLARVPSRWHRPMRHVCRGWRRAVGSPEFRRRRRIAGSTEDIVYLVQAAPADKSKSSTTPECWLATANLTTGDWRRVTHAVPLFAQCASVAGHHVAVLGGWDPDTLRPARDVRVLDAQAATWRRGQPMPDARSFFGCAGSDDGDVVHVAGGHDESRRPLRSGWAYSVAADAWRALPDMREARDEPQLVVVASWPSSGSGGGGARLFAASGYPTVVQGACKKTAECYTTAGGDEAWSDEGSMVPPEAVLVSVGRGKLWAVGAGKGGVREYYWADGTWREVADGPPGMKACVMAVGIGGGDGVLVFGKVQRRANNAAGGLGKYAAWVMRMGTGGARGWNRVPVPPGFCTFVYAAAAVRV
ncbi:F-box/kelch-repeat protein At2g44130 [Brachypodium distachyon]|uniref:F-box domain-containing protein n=1 Tax=Brachypodium distachyon TaxID=15368 RepID=A0A0Q3I245_BRADI|nr:F-box/kelch-repeat protein At2g44130 [Brachypodium distachyon]KQJ99930.1 hypothetical protein BRADI_3g46090v3 [Brachypodium distachyon]|eukprot:XP_003572627.1 F-box/kelch-repeat protein At2g44130 [Brachypodium distachyon]